MKSDTPRTQAAIDSIGRYLKNMDSEASLENALAMVNQLEKLSAQLERELNEAKKKLAMCQWRLNQYDHPRDPIDPPPK